MGDVAAPFSSFSLLSRSSWRGIVSSWGGPSNENVKRKKILFWNENKVIFFLNDLKKAGRGDETDLRYLKVLISKSKKYPTLKRL